jgi:hypothetical protein
VNAEQEKITLADQATTKAASDIASADQRIADAKARAAAAPNPAAKTQAEADQSKAEADKVKAEADRTKAQAEKAAAEAAKATAITARDKAFSNLKGTYEAIEGDATLSPLIDKVPNDPTLDLAFKAGLQMTIKRLKQKAPLANDQEKDQAARDYAQILHLVGGIVAEEVGSDVTLFAHLQEVMKANQ